MVLLIQNRRKLWGDLISFLFSYVCMNFLSDDPCDLKAESNPDMDSEITAKERGVLEENNKKEQMERSEEEEGEEKKLKEEEGEGEEKKRKEEELLTEEQELEELRAQVLQLLLELDEARETSNKHQESFHELQGGKSRLQVIMHLPHLIIKHSSDLPTVCKETWIMSPLRETAAAWLKCYILTKIINNMEQKKN